LVAEAELHIAVFYLYGVIQARESTADPVAVIEQQVGWEKFVQCVGERRRA